MSVRWLPTTPAAGTSGDRFEPANPLATRQRSWPICPHRFRPLQEREPRKYLTPRHFA